MYNNPKNSKLQILTLLRGIWNFKLRIPKRGLVKNFRLFSKKFLYLCHKLETAGEFKHGKTLVDSPHPYLNTFNQ